MGQVHKTETHWLLKSKLAEGQLQKDEAGIR